MASSMCWSLVAIQQWLRMFLGLHAKDVPGASPVGDVIVSEGHRVALRYSLQQPLASLLTRKHSDLGGPGS